jgi:TIR domain/NYN domain
VRYMQVRSKPSRVRVFVEGNSLQYWASKTLGRKLSAADIRRLVNPLGAGSSEINYYLEKYDKKSPKVARALEQKGAQVHVTDLTTESARAYRPKSEEALAHDAVQATIDDIDELIVVCGRVFPGFNLYQLFSAARHRSRKTTLLSFSHKIPKRVTSVVDRFLTIESLLADQGKQARRKSARKRVDMKDFFISYNKADKQWAEWIAWTLEEAGYSVVIQAWDFRPGGNFVLEMQKAAAGTQKTIAVLSDNYLRAEFTQPEWAAAMARDAQGRERTLVPVRVGKCEPTGLLSSIIYVDLVGLPDDDARIALLGAFSARAKPAQAPRFPSAAPSTKVQSVEYPGAPPAGHSLADALMASHPTARGALTANERLALIEKLNALATQLFNMLLFALNPPPGLVPPMPAAQGDRTFALLSWAESSGGCGLAKVLEMLQLVNPQ